MTVAVHVQNVRKDFGSITALHDISLEIGDSTFFTLLGPSGCGKTTLLRMIAGFETPTAGEIFLFGDEIERLPPHRRPINTVFQNYALFPHMTVAENVGFGLKMLGWTARDTSARVAETLALVKLDSFAQRRPAQLSGGQQQRVALARAMAPRPKVLLLDEPLSALDLKLRQAMRAELKALQRETGITFVFVTHDQEEALTMSDQIAVMSAGQVQQIGTPQQIYEAPKTRFVAEFVGETNLLDVTIEAGPGPTARCRLPGGVEIAARPPEDRPAMAGPGVVSIRPERLRLVDPGEGDFDGEVVQTTYLGTDLTTVLRLTDATTLAIRSQNTGDAAPPMPGTRTGIALATDAARLLAD